jgi:succinate dehydrogenase/fumarate reductase flavoprotein subunit
MKTKDLQETMQDLVGIVRNEKSISKIASVKQMFLRLREYIHWMRSGIKC